MAIITESQVLILLYIAIGWRLESQRFVVCTIHITTIMLHLQRSALTPVSGQLVVMDRRMLPCYHSSHFLTTVKNDFLGCASF